MLAWEAVDWPNRNAACWLTFPDLRCRVSGVSPVLVRVGAPPRGAGSLDSREGRSPRQGLAKARKASVSPRASQAVGAWSLGLIPDDPGHAALLSSWSFPDHGHHPPCRWCFFRGHLGKLQGCSEY